MNALFTVIWKVPRTRILETMDLPRTPFFNHLCNKLRKWTEKIRGWDLCGTGKVICPGLMECTSELRLHLSRKRSKAGFFPQHKPVISRWYGNDKHHPRLCKKADDAGDTINPRDWGCHSRAPWPQELPHGKEEVGEWQRNQGEATGMMRIGRNHSQGKKQSGKEGKWKNFGVMQGLFIEPVLEGEVHCSFFFAWGLDWTESFSQRQGWEGQLRGDLGEETEDLSEDGWVGVNRA